MRSNKIVLLITGLFTGVLFAVLSVRPAYAIDVINPGFESWSCAPGQGCIPTDWTMWGQTQWQQEATNKHSGSYSAKYSGSVPPFGGGHKQTMTGFTVGATYRISGWTYRYYGKSVNAIAVQWGANCCDGANLVAETPLLQWHFFEKDFV